MIGDKPNLPKEITRDSAPRIVLDAIEEYMGSEALDTEMSPHNPETEVALERLELLVDALITQKEYRILASLLDDRIAAKRQWLAERMVANG